MIDLNTKIRSLKGEEYAMSYPTNSDIERAKEKTGKKDITIEDLPKETLGNILTVCLTEYPVNEKKEVFLINGIAGWLTSGGKQDLSPILKEFLVKHVLPYSTHTKTKILNKDTGKEEYKTTGKYQAWVIGKVYELLGIKE